MVGHSGESDLIHAASRLGVRLDLLVIILFLASGCDTLRSDFKGQLTRPSTQGVKGLLLVRVRLSATT